MVQTDGANLVARIRRDLDELGFDVVWPFRGELLEPTATGALGVLVGNSAALWPKFRAARKSDPSLRGASDPLDRYVEQSLITAFTTLGTPFALRFAHTPPPDALPIQRLAEAAGLCGSAPCKLSIHPTLGPWLALRAAALLESPCTLGDAPAVSPCARCPAPCREPFERARLLLARVGSVEATAESWIAVRDACPVGRGYRYCATQLDYHYAKRRAALDEA